MTSLISSTVGSSLTVLNNLRINMDSTVSHEPMPEFEIKLVAVGDGAVGKTTLLMSYSYGEFIDDHIPTIFDNYSVIIRVDDRYVRLSLFDTAGQEGFDGLRPLSYPGTDVFLVCFSLVNKTSLMNVRNKWIPELKRMRSRAKVLLVGMKKDLRDSSLGEKMRNADEICSFQDGLRVAKEISAAGYLECSSKAQDGIREVFEEAIRCVLIPMARKSVIQQSIDCISCVIQ